MTCQELSEREPLEQGLSAFKQSELAFFRPAITPEELQRRWATDHTGRRQMDVRVVVTRNRRTMISVRRQAGRQVDVRLHHAFLTAPTEVLEDVRRYVHGRDREAWGRVGTFARGIDGGPARQEVRRPVLRTRGRVHDLTTFFTEVNRDHFHGRVACGIGWGRPGRRRGRRVRCMRFGSWNPSQNMVIIHPWLDSPHVPAEFVRYIVFHEMLHTTVPMRVIGRRRRFHPPEFRRLERAFPDLARVRAMGKAILESF